jgi:polyphosphate kinase
MPMEFFDMILEEAQDPTQLLLVRSKLILSFDRHVDELFMNRGFSPEREQLTGAVAELSPGREVY